MHDAEGLINLQLEASRTLAKTTKKANESDILALCKQKKVMLDHVEIQKHAVDMTPQDLFSSFLHAISIKHVALVKVLIIVQKFRKVDIPSNISTEFMTNVGKSGSKEMFQLMYRTYDFKMGEAIVGALSEDQLELYAHILYYDGRITNTSDQQFWLYKKIRKTIDIITLDIAIINKSKVQLAENEARIRKRTDRMMLYLKVIFACIEYKHAHPDIYGQYPSISLDTILDATINNKNWNMLTKMILEGFINVNSELVRCLIAFGHYNIVRIILDLAKKRKVPIYLSKFDGNITDLIRMREESLERVLVEYLSKSERQRYMDYKKMLT